MTYDDVVNMSKDEIKTLSPLQVLEAMNTLLPFDDLIYEAQACYPYRDAPEVEAWKELSARAKTLLRTFIKDLQLNVTEIERVRSEGLLKHALGWPDRYRNHFCATSNGRDDHDWQKLVSEGLAELIHQTDSVYSYNTYTVTQKGIDLLENGDNHGDQR